MALNLPERGTPPTPRPRRNWSGWRTVRGRRRWGRRGGQAARCASSVGRGLAPGADTGSMPETDPLRRLLDVVVEDGDGSLAGMAGGAHLSPFHFQRTVSARTGESPSALRRRVLLERAAWRLQRGTSVTEAAFDAEYDSVDGSPAPSAAPTAARRPSCRPPRSAGTGCPRPTVCTSIHRSRCTSSRGRRAGAPPGAWSP
ncbi:helix-turn-helix domain-containing protein [Brachybacterium aquaticum]|uniref:helix-turn-helix domain-containing protein n=1 Tax=Brachybacterium aquaticum TaxID=1432564 RepID=UPI0035E44B6C